MLDGAAPIVGREARVARTASGQAIKNVLALPKGCITVLDELGRPLKQLAVTLRINDKPPRQATTDDFGRVYPLVHEIDEVTIEVTDAHESGRGDSLVTPSGQHFEHGGDGPRGGA
jgi:hypothetical protein